MLISSVFQTKGRVEDDLKLIPDHLKLSSSLPSSCFGKTTKPPTRKTSWIAILSRPGPKTNENKPTNNAESVIDVIYERPTTSKPTKWFLQGPWTSKPMPQISEVTKRTYPENEVSQAIGFLQILNRKLARFYEKKRFFQFKVVESLLLDGPYVNPVAGCTCGECEQEFYLNKYVGYGVDVYGRNPCMAIPAHCEDFAVVYYC